MRVLARSCSKDDCRMGLKSDDWMVGGGRWTVPISASPGVLPNGDEMIANLQ